ncbi:hypothetical protein GH733_002511 [Mirounga leonina]|nr:hypothetical protein GH733_002511 [Mirounga leonina]
MGKTTSFQSLLYLQPEDIQPELNTGVIKLRSLANQCLLWPSNTKVQATGVTEYPSGECEENIQAVETISTHHGQVHHEKLKFIGLCHTQRLRKGISKITFKDIVKNIPTALTTCSRARNQPFFSNFIVDILYTPQALVQMLCDTLCIIFTRRFKTILFLCKWGQPSPVMLLPHLWDLFHLCDQWNDVFAFGSRASCHLFLPWSVPLKCLCKGHQNSSMQPLGFLEHLLLGLCLSSYISVLFLISHVIMETSLVQTSHEELLTYQGEDAEAKESQDHHVNKLLHRAQQGPNNDLQTWGGEGLAVAMNTQLMMTVQMMNMLNTKLIEVDDEHKLRTFYEKRTATEVAAYALGEEWKGYVVQISDGNEKQSFPMKQGVLTHGRVRLLLSKGHSCYRPRRTGERKHKSVPGCIVDANLRVLNLVIVKKREKDIPGLTDTAVPHRLGPKRARRICKLFNLSKEDDVCQYVVRKPLTKKTSGGGTPETSASHGLRPRAGVGLLLQSRKRPSLCQHYTHATIFRCFNLTREPLPTATNSIR